jgi:hypothetical protein
VTGHKVLEDVHEDSVHFPSQINRFLFNCPDGPQCLEASTLKMSRHQRNIVRKLGQASPISTWSWILVDTIWEVSVRLPDDVATRPGAIQRSRIFWFSFMGAEKSDSEDRPDAQPSHLDVVLLWEESRYSRKAVTEDRSDEANFCPDNSKLESKFV